MKIGMIIAVEIEAFINEYKNEFVKTSINGFEVFSVKKENLEIFAIHSGAGQVFAAAATMLLINEFKIDLIINYGIVGSLTEDVKTYGKCIIEKIVHYNFDTSAVDNCEVGKHLEYDSIYIPANKKLIDIARDVDNELQLVCCASGDKFIADIEEKKKLNKDFNAQICEMEAAAIILTADRAKIPCLFIKTVSDSLSGGAEEFTKTFNETGSLCMKIVKQIVDKF